VICSLVAVEQASVQLNTRALPGRLHCESGNFPFPETADRLFLNGASSPSGDAFCALRIVGGGLLLEVHQYKLYAQEKLTAALMEDERAKAANDSDAFLMFSTFDDVDPDDIPPSTGVVVKRNFDDYYGPFAGRAFWLANLPQPKINEAQRSFLLSLKGIGPAYANRILEERQRLPFADAEDCYQRTKIPREALKGFQW